MMTTDRPTPAPAADERRPVFRLSPEETEAIALRLLREAHGLGPGQPIPFRRQARRQADPRWLRQR